MDLTGRFGIKRFHSVKMEVVRDRSVGVQIDFFGKLDFGMFGLSSFDLGF